MGVFSTARILRLILLVGIGLLAIFTEAAPLGHEADSLPSPDLLFLVIAHFSIRRPGTAITVVVFALALTRDLLTDLPVGIGALSLVMASEALKSLHMSLRRASFGSELMIVALALAGVLGMQWLAVFITFLQPPPVNVMLQQWAMTVALYPVLALILRWMFRIGWRRAERA